MNRQTQTTREPRSQMIIRHTQGAIRNSGLTIAAFAARVAEEYLARVALDERTMEFYAGTTTDTIEYAGKANAQLIKRIINGVVKFPDDLEESWVAALPDSHRASVVRELAARYGLLAARMPVAVDDVSGQMAEFASLSGEFAQTIEALAPIFGDGKCDASDRPHVERALRELDDLMSAAVTLGAQLRLAMAPGTSNVASIERRA